MSSPDQVPDPQTTATRDVVMRYHLSWKARDIDAVLALYHPDVEYNDFFQNRCMHREELADYVRATMPSGPVDFLEHNDRIRVDGDTAFIQYAISVAGGGTFRASEAITVRDGLIWRINEYALLVKPAARPGQDSTQRPAASRLGLSARQLSLLARDLEDYFQRSQPYLDPALDLHQVASATGYTRNQISYLLNQMLGQSFYQYVNQARLAHLLNLLQTAVPPVRIDELAFSAGFNSLSAFYRCFRQHTGLSPKAYLKQLHKSL
ncbi:nuclear transport factor 2 family protein [Pseudomonas sp. LFM046]|uniref:helix-turn-helix domain-containing protein n=1 Tax=Pseudomonas sp. LFM046 TaxID=1608357 RepID=UPI0005CFDC67|nr:nuclear transport factor 2 family protein [Pseudomonas sp. LFM046]